MLLTPTNIRRSIDEAAAAATNAVAVPPRLWLTPQQFTVQSGTPSYFLTQAAGALPSWLLDASTAEGVTTSTLLPDGWISFHIDLWWANAGTGAGDARMRAIVGRYDSGSTTETTVASGGGVVGTAGAQYGVVKTRVQTSLAVTAGSLYVIRALRLATDAADTLANDVAFLGAELVRAS